jgi:hypothetical protein
MRPLGDKFTSNQPEISSFTLSEDRRLLYIGTSHLEATLVVWEISTNLLLQKIVIPSISVIYTIKVAYDNNHIILVGITPEYKPSLVLL